MTGVRPAELFQLDRSTCLALLGVHHVGRLIVPGEDPYVIPLNYVTSDGAVIVRTERRPVVEEIIGRLVVFEVDMFDDRTRSGWSVVVRGRASDVSTELDACSQSSGAIPRTWVPGERDFLICIEPERLTGRLLRGAVTPTSDDVRGYL